MEVSATHVPSELVSALKITPIVATSFCCDGGCSREIDGERESEREKGSPVKTGFKHRIKGSVKKTLSHENEQRTCDLKK